MTKRLDVDRDKWYEQLSCHGWYEQPVINRETDSTHDGGVGVRQMKERKDSTLVDGVGRML